MHCTDPEERCRAGAGEADPESRGGTADIKGRWAAKRDSCQASPTPQPETHISGRHDPCMTASVQFTIAYEELDEDGWIVAQVPEVPGR